MIDKRKGRTAIRIESCSFEKGDILEIACADLRLDDINTMVAIGPRKR